MYRLLVLLSQDKLMTVPSEASSGGSSGNRVFKNNEHGKASAAARLVLCSLLPVDLLLQILL